MLTLLRDLVAHKADANASMLAAVRGSEAASTDPEILELLHHVFIANRFWVSAVRRTTFDAATHASLPRAIEPLIEAFRATQEEEDAWIAAATEADCAALLVDPFIPGGECRAADALTQVCLHSHGHRAQLAKLLRRLGVVPPQTDFIVWLAARARRA